MTEFTTASDQGHAYGGEVLPPSGVFTSAPAPTPVASHQPNPQMQPAPIPMVVNNVVAPPVVVAQKSTGVAFLLTFFFGPLGLFYASVAGGLVMTLIGIPLSIATFGLLGIPVWIGSIIWGCVAADSHNKKMLGAVPAVPPAMTSHMTPQPIVAPPPLATTPVTPMPQPAPAPAYELAALPVPPDLGTCPACAAQWREGTQFCTTCGARRDQLPEPAVVVDVPPTGGDTFVVRRCPQGHAVDPGNAFCPRCGGAAS